MVAKAGPRHGSGEPTFSSLDAHRSATPSSPGRHQKFQRMGTMATCGGHSAAPAAHLPMGNRFDRMIGAGAMWRARWLSGAQTYEMTSTFVGSRRSQRGVRHEWQVSHRCESLTVEYHEQLCKGEQSISSAEDEEDEDPRSRPTLLCIGDGLTAASPEVPSTAWVRAVAARNRGLRVVNAGKPWEGAWHLQGRQQRLVEEFPVLACILVGTTEAVALCSPEKAVSEVLVKQKGVLPRNWRETSARQPSVENFELHLRRVVRALLNAGTMVAIATPPPLGEDFSEAPGRCHIYGPMRCSANEAVGRIAGACRRVAHSEGCEILPLFETLRAKIKALGQDVRTPWTPGSCFGTRVPRMPRDLKAAAAAIRGAAEAHSKRRLTMAPAAVAAIDKVLPATALWQDVWPARERGHFCHDFMHLNERGASVLCGMLQAWIDEKVPSAKKDE